MVKANHSVDREDCNEELLTSEPEMDDPYEASNDSLSQHSGFKRSVKLQSVLFRMRELAETDAKLDERNPSPFDPRSLTDAHPPSSIRAFPDPELELRDGRHGTESLDRHERTNDEKQGVQKLHRVLFTTSDARDHELSFEINEPSIRSSGFMTTRLADASAVEAIPREEQLRLRIQEAVRNQIYSTAAPSPSRSLGKDEMSLVRGRYLEKDLNSSHPMMRKTVIPKLVREPKFNRETHVHLDTRGTQNLTPHIAAELQKETEHRQPPSNMDHLTNHHYEREASSSRGEATIESSSSQRMRKSNIPDLSYPVEDRSTGTAVSIDDSSASSSGGGSTESSSSDVSSIGATRSLRSDGNETATRSSNQAADNAEDRGT
jgi:hypothetical protein